MSTLFISQVRHIKNGEPITEFEDSCQGHDTYDKAVTCAELQKQCLLGKVPDNPLVDKEVMQLTALVEGFARIAGITYEFQLIKRITTDEVLVDA